MFKKKVFAGVIAVAASAFSLLQVQAADLMRLPQEQDYAVIQEQVVEADTSGFYGQLSIFGSYLQDLDPGFSTNPDTSVLSFETDSAWGPGGSVAVGYAFGNGVRLEGEFALRHHEVSSSLNYDDSEYSFSLLSGDIDLTSYALMSNLVYDLQFHPKWQPYLGAGIGAAYIEAGSLDDTVFAYQALAGIGYNVTDNGTITLGYRYFATQDPSFGESFADGTSASLDTSYKTHNIELGYRHRF